MRTVFQVRNKSGYPAGTEITNPDAIFLNEDNAEEFIGYLKDINLDQEYYYVEL